MYELHCFAPKVDRTDIVKKNRRDRSEREELNYNMLFSQYN